MFEEQAQLLMRERGRHSRPDLAFVVGRALEIAEERWLRLIRAEQQEAKASYCMISDAEKMQLAKDALAKLEGLPIAHVLDFGSMAMRYSIALSLPYNRAAAGAIADAARRIQEPVREIYFLAVKPLVLPANGVAYHNPAAKDAA